MEDPSLSKSCATGGVKTCAKGHDYQRALWMSRRTRETGDYEQGAWRGGEGHERMRTGLEELNPKP